MTSAPPGGDPCEANDTVHGVTSEIHKPEWQAYGEMRHREAAAAAAAVGDHRGKSHSQG